MRHSSEFQTQKEVSWSQQRLLLERGYSSLHGANFTKDTLLGSVTGVYVGVWTSEYTELLGKSPGISSVFAATAAHLSVFCGRISFSLGLQGACVASDTACSSSLIALPVLFAPCNAARTRHRLSAERT